jgi:hypothetical protein
MMTIFRDLIKESLGPHFFDKIFIHVNYKNYKETFGVAPTISSLVFKQALCVRIEVGLAQFRSSNYSN